MRTTVMRFMYAVAIIFLVEIPFVNSAEIQITWDANTEPDLAGYKVYVGTSSRKYNSPLDVGKATEFLIMGLDADRVYYIAVTAYDAANNESGYSNEISGLSKGLPDTAEYVPGYVRVFPQVVDGVIGIAWSRNPIDVGYRLYVYNTVNGQPTVLDVGNVNFAIIPTNGSTYVMVEIVALLSDGTESGVSMTAEWMAGNVLGDYRNGTLPENMAVNGMDLVEFATYFGMVVEHCIISEGAVFTECPAPTNIQLADFNKDGVIDGYDLIYLGLVFGLIAPL